jgi:hypothetical protein
VNNDVIDSDDPSVPIRKDWAAIYLVFAREDHDICMGPGVCCLLYPACVVRCRPEPDGLVLVNLVSIDNYLVPVSGSVVLLIAFICLPFDTR